MPESTQRQVTKHDLYTVHAPIQAPRRRASLSVMLQCGYVWLETPMLSTTASAISSIHALCDHVGLYQAHFASRHMTAAPRKRNRYASSCWRADAFRMRSPKKSTAIRSTCGRAQDTAVTYMTLNLPLQ